MCSRKGAVVASRLLPLLAPKIRCSSSYQVNGPLAQRQEAALSTSDQCGFESHGDH